MKDTPDFSQERYKLEWVDVDTLKPKSFQNPNRLTPKERERLRRSIEEQGIAPPLLVRLETNEVIDGEHRWLIARDDLGWEQVPVVKRPMTDAEARIIARRMILARGNEAADLADVLMRELAALDALEDAQMGLLLSDEEISQWDSEIEVELLPDIAEGEIEDQEEFDEDDEPPAAGKRGSRLAAGAAAEDRPRGREGLDFDLTGIGSEPDESDYDEAAEFLERAVATTADLDEEAAPKAQKSDQKPKGKLVAPAPKHHRVNALFLGAEADLVERVLGRVPSARIVQMCRYWELENLDEKFLAAEAAED